MPSACQAKWTGTAANSQIKPFGHCYYCLFQSLTPAPSFLSQQSLRGKPNAKSNTKGSLPFGYCTTHIHTHQEEETLPWPYWAQSHSQQNTVTLVMIFKGSCHLRKREQVSDWNQHEDAKLNKGWHHAHQYSFCSRKYWGHCHNRF